MNYTLELDICELYVVKRALTYAPINDPRLEREYDTMAKVILDIRSKIESHVKEGW